MNIVLSPEEMLHVLQSVMKSPMHDPREHATLVSKIKKPILGALEREEDRMKDAAFSVWNTQEEKKIEELKQQNSEIRPVLKTARRK